VRSGQVQELMNFVQRFKQFKMEGTSEAAFATSLPELLANMANQPSQSEETAVAGSPVQWSWGLYDPRYLFYNVWRLIKTVEDIEELHLTNYL